MGPLPFPTPDWNGPQCGRETECESTEVALAKQHASEATDRKLLIEGRELTRVAAEAARGGDCAAVEAYEAQALQLPDVHRDGGAHDNIFLRDPDIVRCLVERRDLRESCRASPHPGCDLPPPPARPARRDRAACMVKRAALFARIQAAARGARRVLIATIETCPVASEAEYQREQAWLLVKTAASEAAVDNCSPALADDSRIMRLDPELHALAFASEVDVARCLAPRSPQTCVDARAIALRKAQTIADTNERGKALAAVPECK